MQTIKLNIFGMHSKSCDINIDDELGDSEDVKRTNTNCSKQQTEVIFDSKEISIDKIVSIIRNIDDKYDAEVAESTSEE